MRSVIIKIKKVAKTNQFVKRYSTSIRSFACTAIADSILEKSRDFANTFPGHNTRIYEII